MCSEVSFFGRQRSMSCLWVSSNERRSCDDPSQMDASKWIHLNFKSLMIMLNTRCTWWALWINQVSACADNVSRNVLNARRTQLPVACRRSKSRKSARAGSVCWHLISKHSVKKIVQLIQSINSKGADSVIGTPTRRREKELSIRYNISKGAA